ncbi:MAG: M3 family metallopeptidase [Paludibacteraceae bacterium]|nr:M3 family metallopeptidase [Paludibacteraceae bacterium]
MSRQITIALIAISIIGIMNTSCNNTNDTSVADNPFFEVYNTPYGVPPFDQIRDEHYLPAFIEGIRRDSIEIEAIAYNIEEPTFENTIAALDTTGRMLNRVEAVFFNLQSAKTNAVMDSIAEQIMPLITEHEDNTLLNEQLFSRVKTVYDRRESLGLTPEQLRLTEETYKTFVRSGAELNEDQKNRLREINKQLGLLDLKFAANVMADVKAYQRFVTDTAELAGLPESVREAAALDAKEAGHEGEWLFTAKKSSFIPVLQYSSNRTLRRELLTAYSLLGNNGNDNDNKQVINQIMKLRVEKAQLFGFKTPAAYILDDTMAKTPEAAYDLLMKVWQPALNQAKKEAAMLQTIMNEEGRGEKLEAWDWWYYAEKLRKQQYDLNEDQLTPYFEINNVRQGVFGLATRLYGLQFKKLENMPVYDKDVEVFEVLDHDSTHLGILYTDYYPRDGKRAGAWMENISRQYNENGCDIRPVIINVGNLTKPTADKPSLLTMDDVETLFHEFGHALHGLMSRVNYARLCSPNVSRDFVEMPSQVMENWCFTPEVMSTYAFHYKTGELMPDSLIEKIQHSRTFNQGFITTELIAASILDMDYHMRSTMDDIDVEAFEAASMKRIGLIPEILPRYRSTYFNHIFTTGYEAGYYSYTWSAVYDADAFAAFQETGDVLNPEMADKFRKNILERGNTLEPMQLYKDFRGRDADPAFLLKRKGFN